VDRKERCKEVQEHIGDAIGDIDEKGNTQSAVQHLIWAIGFIADEVFKEEGS
jgi:hypothetical protein